MSLKANLEARGLQRTHVERAIEFTEKVASNVVNNASKNTTGAQAMKGNLSTFVRDLEVLYALRDEYVAEDEEKAKQVEALEKAAAKSKTAAAKAEKPVEPAEAEADVSKADKG